MSELLKAFERVDIPAALLSPDRRVVAANSSLASLLGTAQSCLIGVDLHEVLSAAATGQAGQSKIYCVERDSKNQWCRLDEKPVDDGFLAILTDVGPEHRSLEDIRRFYATRDRLLLDGKIGTWRFDPDAELYHFSNELSLGHDGIDAPIPVKILQRIQHADDRHKDTAIRERITHEGGVANDEIRYREADGRWTHLNVHYRAGRRLPSGRYEMFGISQDITAVAIARDEANQTTQRLALALRAAHAGVFEYDYKNQSFWLSPELIDFIGPDSIDEVQRDPLTLFIPSDRVTAAAEFARAGRETHTTSTELRILHNDDSRWVKLYFDVKKRDAEGRPLLGVGLLIDIDERKRQELALIEARKSAEYANRTKTEFLANMSHELRTPLNAILGFSEMIERQMFGPIGSKYAEYAQDIHRSGQHLLELVNDVLDLAKLEAGKLDLRESNIFLPELVDECMKLVRGRADTGRVSLKADLSPTVQSLCADERAVRQLLLNFLSNAIKFTPEGGCVTVRISCDAQKNAYISVSDTGIGMSTADIAVALSPFGQIDSKLARKYAGTGLGLPICKSLVELHGGQLTVASVPNEGTTITAQFPHARVKSMPAAAPAA